MKIEINSTWKFIDVEGLEDGTYRVLKIEDSISSLIVFNLEYTKIIVRPVLLQLEHFYLLFKEKKIKKVPYEQYPYLLNDEDKFLKSIN
ncbi:TPA: hypothetical protein U2K68_001996 [Providencia stuartii]|nr:hypothetical protein [Providencia stuartii]HEM7166331.1 hypothetical protein [Providencia stuartii]